MWLPRVTVAAIVEQNGAFLLVEEEVDGAPKLNQPAGHLEDNESLIEAVKRETLEETGWQFAPSALTGIYRWKHPGTLDTYIRFAFTGEVFDYDKDRPLDAGIIGPVWLRRDEVTARRSQHRSPQLLRCIDDYLAGKRLPLDCLVDVQGF